MPALPPLAPLPPRVGTALARGDRIEAIRLLREAHPALSLAEAVLAVDRAANRAADPAAVRAVARSGRRAAREAGGDVPGWPGLRTADGAPGPAAEEAEAGAAHAGVVVSLSGAHGAAPEALPAHVLAELARGQRIEAIRLLREATGLGLKEAKEAIDAAHPPGAGGRPRPLAPGEVPAPPGTRWLPWLVLAAVAAVAGAWWWPG